MVVDVPSDCFMWRCLVVLLWFHIIVFAVSYCMCCLMVVVCSFHIVCRVLSTKCCGFVWRWLSRMVALCGSILSLWCHILCNVLLLLRLCHIVCVCGIHQTVGGAIRCLLFAYGCCILYAYSLLCCVIEIVAVSRGVCCLI